MWWLQSGSDRRDQIHRGEVGLTSKKLSGTSITDAHRLNQLLIESNIEKVSGLQCNFMFNDSTQLLISDHSGPVICRTDRLYFLPAIAIRNRHAIEKGGESSSPRQATRQCSPRKGSSCFWQWRANRGLLPAVITCLGPSEQETRKLPERPGKSSETQTCCRMLQAGRRKRNTDGISAYPKRREFWLNERCFFRTFWCLIIFLIEMIIISGTPTEVETFSDNCKNWLRSHKLMRYMHWSIISQLSGNQSVNQLKLPSIQLTHQSVNTD